MHNPRGSNNRNAHNSNNKARRNANRLFDSQNNDNGGYSAPKAYPFPCFMYEDGSQEKAECNAYNTGLSDAEAKAAVASDGTLFHPEATNTPNMYYYSGSILPIEWTAQHGFGTNGKVHSEIVLQVQCEDDEPGVFSFTDDCGSDVPGKICQPRDGTAINNQDVTNTETIDDDNVDEQDDYRYGRHESYRFYQFCRNVERNKGLFIADQNLNNNENDGRFTRQNANGQRYGLECPEESEYHPWWNPSPWIDIAIITSDMEKCEADAKESQNVMEKYYCVCPTCTGDGNLPNNARHCIEEGGTWTRHPSWKEWMESKNIAGKITEPECVHGAFSRDNHLGNVGGNGQPFYYNWTVPEFLEGRNRCVLRIRYNMTSTDFDSISRFGDSQSNDELSPLRDRNESPEDVFEKIDGLCNTDNCKLGLAINTNQIGRTFQDRSYIFEVKRRPDDVDCDKIYNLNVRGKRGNIVQTYPAVEYDFIPNKLRVTEDDCIHFQLTGSDYNPARDPNNGEGGPPNPNNSNEGKTDRSNLVQMNSEAHNRMITSAEEFQMFKGGVEVFKKLAFLDQDVEDPSKCLPYSILEDVHDGNNNAIDRDHRNCMKLSGQRTPYFDAGLLKPKTGVWHYMSTRNNNFSNRGQKGVIEVGQGGLSGGSVAGIVIGALVGIGLVGGAAMFLAPRFRRTGLAKNKPAVTVSKSVPAAPTPASSLRVAVAMYDHKTNEPGELEFKKGDRITVLKMDPSGWWEGRHTNGRVGIFPSNYVQLSEGV